MFLTLRIRIRISRAEAIRPVLLPGRLEGLQGLAQFALGLGSDLLLFGNILLLGKADLWLIIGLDVFIILVAALFHKKLLAVCFDEEFARARGIHTGFYFILLLIMTSLTVVLLIRVVGIVMVIALLTLPSAIAGIFSRRLTGMMALSVIFCCIFTVAGLAVSYAMDLPSGPVIILLAGITYIVVIVVSAFMRK